MDMRTIVLVLLAAVCLRAADAKYVGGTVAALPAESEGNLGATDDLFLEYRCKGRELHIPYDKINLLEYGQNVSRRVIAAAVVSPLFLLSKKRQHFLSIGFSDTEGRQQAMVFRIGKDKIRPLLVSLEARTGLKVQYQDEQARKAGKG